MLRGLFVTDTNMALLTDLYQLTMSAAYRAHKRNELATFELYFRRLPLRRSFVIAAGLEQALHYISDLRFSATDIAWLKSLQQFRDVSDEFFEYLKSFKFTGDVWAMPEGTPAFPLEPLIQVRAPLIEAQMLETYLLCTINMQSMIATKASRIVKAAAGRGVIDFGTRRAHGPQAGVLAGRASYVGGCIGTSNVLAGRLSDIPVYGTAAHSFVMSFPTELEAFQSYQSVFPESSVLLIDTYDTVRAASMLKNLKLNVAAVRIDSGDLLQLSQEVRRVLDADGLQNVQIFVSGDLNEYKIEDLIAKGAPIDLFGVGTELVTSYDDPALSGVYKIVESTIDEKTVPRMKISPGKLSYPCRKQIYRFTQNDLYSHDLITLFSDAGPAGGTPLLRCYIRNGQLIESPPSIHQIRETTAAELKRLPPSFHKLSSIEDYPVIFSDSLRNQLQQQNENRTRPD